MGQLEQILIVFDKHDQIQQEVLSDPLPSIYSIENIPSVFIERYAIAPFVKDYLSIIDNGIECHYLGLNYASVSTLIPVVEEIARKLSKHKHVEDKLIRSTIKNLCVDLSIFYGDLDNKNVTIFT